MSVALVADDAPEAALDDEFDDARAVDEKELRAPKYGDDDGPPDDAAAIGRARRRLP